MIHIAGHKIKALAVYACVVAFEWLRDGQQTAIAAAGILGVLVFFIFLSELIAWLSSYGPMESMASDHRSGLAPNLVAIVFWILFLIGCAFFLFNFKVY